MSGRCEQMCPMDAERIARTAKTHNLTARQTDVMERMLDGLSSIETAERLGLSSHTARRRRPLSDAVLHAVVRLASETGGGILMAKDAGGLLTALEHVTAGDHRRKSHTSSPPTSNRRHALPKDRANIWLSPRGRWCLLAVCRHYARVNKRDSNLRTGSRA